jgi:hypothetical protein
MIVLGVDPSLSDTGWAVIDTEQSGSDHLVASGRIRTDSDDLIMKRYARQRDELREVVEIHEPAYAGIERPPHNASYSAGLYPIYINNAETFFDCRLPFCIIMPPTLKAFAREVLDDSGKMHKQDMVEAAQDLMGGKHVYDGRLNHNIADGYLLAYYAGRFKKLLDGQIEKDDLTDKEHRTFAKTVKRRKTGKIDKVGMMYHEGDKHYAFDDPKYDDEYQQQETIF